MFELMWLSGLLHAVEAHVLNMSWMEAATTFAPLPGRKKKSKKQQKKELHTKRHRKMHRRATRHMRHMQKVHEAIRQHKRMRAGISVAGGGVGEVKAGANMNADMVSKVGAAAQKVQQTVHQATKPKTLGAQQQLNAMRQKTHASRVQAQRRAASVFGHAR